MLHRLGRVLAPLVVATLAVAFVVLVATACGADERPPTESGGPHPATLAGTQWAVVSIAGQQPVLGSEPTIVFAADRVSGSGGCNQFGGGYRYDPATGRIAFAELGMTAMACLEGLRNARETQFFQLLGTATEVSLAPTGGLVIRAPAGELVGRLAAPGAAGPAGSQPDPGPS